MEHLLTRTPWTTDLVRRTVPETSDGILPSPPVAPVDPWACEMTVVLGTDDVERPTTNRTDEVPPATTAVAVDLCRRVADALVAGGTHRIPPDVRVQRLRPGCHAVRSVVGRVLRAGPTRILSTAELIAGDGERVATLLITFRRNDP